jgi:nucleoside-diphosphate-sugar epimerase
LEKLIADNRVEKIIVIDKQDLRKDLKENSKVFFMHKNLVDDWEGEVKNIEEKNNFKVSRAVHLAWQIRTMYGKQKLQNHWNIDGSQKVFNFISSNPNMKSLVHFSTVASYGALPTNTFDFIFTEDKDFRKTNYLYAEEKRIVEKNLDKTFTKTGGGEINTNIFVIRPASITGERGRERTGFGLQSALAGKIKSKNFVENFIFNIIKKFLNFMPATSGWARQFIHEQDIVEAVLTMSFSNKKNTKIEKYNLCPTSAKATAGVANYIDAKEMGNLLNKRVIFLHPQLVRVLCFLAWHGTLGKIPTSLGVWKAYAYPIVVDGSKMLRDFPQFKYKKDIREAYKA